MVVSFYWEEFLIIVEEVVGFIMPFASDMGNDYSCQLNYGFNNI